MSGETYDLPPSGPRLHSGVCVVPHDRQYWPCDVMDLCFRLLLEDAASGSVGGGTSCLCSCFGVLGGCYNLQYG